MKQTNSHRALYDAVTDIDPAMIEAATAPNHVLPIMKRIAAMAAVLALLIGAVFFWPGEVKTEDGQIIEAPGVLKVYACDFEGISGSMTPQRIELSNANRFLTAVWNPLFNAPFPQAILLEVSSDYFDFADVTFVVSSEDGVICKETELANGAELQFAHMEGFVSAMFDRMYSSDTFYLDIIIYADGQVAGYGVISLGFYDLTCYAYEFKTVCFPIVDGNLQKVSEEYVWEQINEYKRTKTSEEAAEYLRQSVESLHENG